MKILIQHPERRTTQAIVVKSSTGNILMIAPAQCLELDLQEGEEISLHFEAPAVYEIPAPEGDPDDLSAEDEQALADAFASLDGEGVPGDEGGQG